MRKKLIIISVILVIILLILLLSLPYKILYNIGNKLYEDQNYTKAIKVYNVALKFFPYKYDECSIRINLALATLKPIDDYTDIYSNKDKILIILNNAEDILCEKGCAHKEDSNGHSREAEKLKEDIEKMKKKLSEEEENENQQEEQENNNSKQNETKEEKLKEIQSQGIQERKEKLDSYIQMQNYEYYPGKRW